MNCSPVSGRITSHFGMRTHPVTGARSMHSGIDIAGDIGDPVYSPFDGVIKSVYYNSTGGHQVVVTHPGGKQTGYAHLNRAMVTPGQIVRPGDQIGELGATGNATGPHLHFTYKVNGVPVDPYGIFDFETDCSTWIVAPPKSKSTLKILSNPKKAIAIGGVVLLGTIVAYNIIFSDE